MCFGWFIDCRTVQPWLVTRYEVITFRATDNPIRPFVVSYLLDSLSSTTVFWVSTTRLHRDDKTHSKDHRKIFSSFPTHRACCALLLGISLQTLVVEIYRNLGEINADIDLMDSVFNRTHTVDTQIHVLRTCVCARCFMLICWMRVIIKLLHRPQFS